MGERHTVPSYSSQIQKSCRRLHFESIISFVPCREGYGLTCKDYGVSPTPTDLLHFTALQLHPNWEELVICMPHPQLAIAVSTLQCKDHNTENSEYKNTYPGEKGHH